jgi:hypothetical protein
MAVFAVIAINPSNSDRPNNDPLASVIEQKFGDTHLRVAQGHWLIKASSTTQQVSKDLGIAGGALGQAIVYNVGGYFGYASNTVWEWLKINMASGGTSG